MFWQRCVQKLISHAPNSMEASTHQVVHEVVIRGHRGENSSHTTFLLTDANSLVAKVLAGRERPHKPTSSRNPERGEHSDELLDFPVGSLGRVENRRYLTDTTTDLQARRTDCRDLSRASSESQGRNDIAPYNTLQMLSIFNGNRAVKQRTKVLAKWSANAAALAKHYFTKTVYYGFFPFLIWIGCNTEPQPT